MRFTSAKHARATRGGRNGAELLFVRLVLIVVNVVALVYIVVNFVVLLNKNKTNNNNRNSNSNNKNNNTRVRREQVGDRRERDEQASTTHSG